MHRIACVLSTRNGHAVLPGMRGLDLARQLRASRPATPCVVISGYSAPEGCDIPWLCKPVDFDALLHAITPA